MDSLGIPWYSTGTVDVTQGSSNVTGVGTNWLNAGLKKGDIFTLDKIRIYQVWDVENNTSLTLQEAFQGATGTAQVYFVIRNFAATMQAEIAAQVAELVNKYESYIDTELKQIVGPAGPTSFPYRGTWATGRSYNALDVVQYGTQLYMALYGHTSASTNAPDATGTAWTPLAVSLSGTVLNSFANGSSVNPNGTNGISIVGKNTNNDVTLSAAADAIRLQQMTGGTTTTLLQLPASINADITALQTGKQDKGNYVTAEDTGWVDFETMGSYRKKNGYVSVAVHARTPIEFGVNQNVNIGTLPIGCRPTNMVIAPIISISSNPPNVQDIIGNWYIITTGIVYLRFTPGVSINQWVSGYITFPV